MGRFISARNTIKQQSTRSRRARQVISEALEDRTLMSLTIDVRGTDGSTSATVNAVGEVLHLELVAVITDATNTPSQDGLQDVAGRIISTAAQGHAVAGNLAAANVSPFNAFGAAPGTDQDVNGDGNIDVGGTSGTASVGDFFARSSPLQTAADGSIVGTTLTFEIATFTYTVTTLNKGGTTDINFAPLISTTPDAAAWLEDDAATNNLNGVYQAGAAYPVSDAALIVPPVAVNDSATATRNTALDIKELANDDVVVALNPASVVVVTAAAHGTTALQSDGSILYTPATGYTGTDSFTYHVADTDGRVSNVATVSINVVLAPAPTAGAVSATTLRNQAVSVDVLADDNSVVTLDPTSVMVVTTPSHGTAVKQSDGTILYTPNASFVGTDTFTYTVSDSNQETSNPGTVTITVNTPVPPVADNDAFTTSEGAPLSLNVLSNDVVTSAPLAPSTVDVDTDAQHGVTAVQTDGTILYTPTAGYIGSDSFTYSVADTLGDISNVAVVSLTVTAGIPPVATNFTATALTGQATIINVVSNVTSAATLTPGTLALVTGASHGIAVAETDGTVSYTPTTGYVGTDTFTYTVGDVNGDNSNTATATVYVGAAISKAKGATSAVTFVDGAGGAQTLTLSAGVADVFFSGSGNYAVAKNGKATITNGASLEIDSIALLGTTKSSSLAIKGVAAKPVTIGGITDASPLGSIVASASTLNGAITLNSVGALTIGSIANAQISVGAGLPGKMSLTTGAVSDSSLTTLVPITTLKVGSWTDASAETITAPSIGTLTVAGSFDPSLTLTGAGKDFTTAKITGALAGGTWHVAGSVGTITAGSIASSWTPTIVGALTTLSVKSGGLAAPIAAGSIGTMTVAGNLTGSITTTMAKTIKIVGAISGSTLSFTASGGLKTLTATGAVSNATITSAGNIGTITVGSLSGSTISSGLASTVTFANATAATLGAATISSVKITSKTADAFTGSDILAAKLTSAAVGSVTTDNGEVAFGIATKAISSFTGIFANGAIHLGHAQLVNETILQLYVNQQSVAFGDFALDIDT